MKKLRFFILSAAALMVVLQFSAAPAKAEGIYIQIGIPSLEEILEEELDYILEADCLNNFSEQTIAHARLIMKDPARRNHFDAQYLIILDEVIRCLSK